MLFLDRFRELAGNLGRSSSLTPHRAIEEWSEFVDDCTEGYEGTLFEYWDDMSIRGFLQRVVDDPEVKEVPELAWFKTEVRRVDEKFAGLLAQGFDVQGGRGWWERKIPHVAGREMAENVKEQYGYEIEVI
ncbi:hypothetical protein [Streptomyces lunaelactis]|uniref:hypothetical protein n=2 Tax=Streptomyces lunaelactis TaxID=1535768 RepID=UPI0015848049|nr:hypothetical protein [Streptomyces lunaelactis]NUK06137.1 hypothetical protein [Streptomyces lunaelactis]NUK20689.1 hypothetical protein [Streptomyces lunaelactis]NUK27833.1 hypothetical protein [Streptomyces lunaelactis]